VVDRREDTGVRRFEVFSNIEVLSLGFVAGFAAEARTRPHFPRRKLPPFPAECELRLAVRDKCDIAAAFVSKIF
jgi:hypothetical protein